MRITIDTQQDSKEHIMKAIELIQKLVEVAETPTGSGFSTMFGDQNTEKTDPQLKPYEY